MRALIATVAAGCVMAFSVGCQVSGSAEAGSPDRSSARPARASAEVGGGGGTTVRGGASTSGGANTANNEYERANDRSR
jgi:hypothetical protein